MLFFKALVLLQALLLPLRHFFVHLILCFLSSSICSEIKEWKWAILLFLLPHFHFLISILTFLSLTSFHIIKIMKGKILFV